MRRFWLSPNTVGNGILWLVGIALNIGGWVSHTIAYVLFGVAFAWSLYTGIYWWKNRKRIQLKTVEEAKSGDLSNILTRMHDRMMYFKTVRTKQRINTGEFEKATPILLDKFGLVRLGEWDDFKKKWIKEARRVIPKSPRKRESHKWRYKVLGKASELRDELKGSKEWQIEDLEKVGEWLDGLQIGLGELRDNDKEYQELIKELRPHMSGSVQRKLIDKHISISYGYCSTLLAINYSKRLPRGSFERIVYSALIENRISPHEIELALNEILEEAHVTGIKREGNNQNDNKAINHD